MGGADAVKLESLIDEILDGQTRNMHRVYRYSTRPLAQPEDNAQHSWYASWYCLLIYHAAAAQLPECPLDLGTLLEKAIVHDLEESWTGDIVRPFKHSDETLRDEIRRVGRDRVEEWAYEQCIPAALVTAVLGAKDGLEGKVVTLADLLCVCSLAYENLKRGNRYLIPTIVRVRHLLVQFSQSCAQPLWEVADPDRAVLRLLSDLALATHQRTAKLCESEHSNVL